MSPDPPFEMKGGPRFGYSIYINLPSASISQSPFLSNHEGIEQKWIRGVGGRFLIKRLFFLVAGVCLPSGSGNCRELRQW